MIVSGENQISKALGSRCEGSGFFFRTFVLAACVAMTCGVFVAPGDAVAQEVVVEFVDAEELDFGIRLRDPDGKKLVPETLVGVWVDGSDQKTDPKILGKTTVQGDFVLFTPRFPLRRGKSYVVVCAGGKDGGGISTVLDVPAKESKPTTIEAIYPSAERIPENLLRFYVQFSAPMRKGDIYKHIQILKEDGNPVDLPFLEIEQELWSRDSTRLTLLLDPGRIKRGLKPREDMGPILESGRRYSLVIDGKWKDANGKPVGDDVTKQFLAIDEDRVQPNPSKWKVVAPKSDSKQALTVTFVGSLDWSMLFRSISVFDSESKEVAGSISVSEHESVWTFVPEQEWAKGKYSISVDPNLEDAVGNSVGRQFDVDVFKKTEPSAAAANVAVPFSINE